MLSSWKKSRLVRKAIKLAQSEFSRSVGERVVLPRNEVEVLERFIMNLGDGILVAHQLSRVVRRDVLGDAVGQIHSVYDDVARSQGLGEDWSRLMTGFTQLGVVFYLAQLGRPDLGEAFAEAIQSAKSESTVRYVPTNELALLLQGGVNAYDPEFRDQAPELARMLDEALADDGSTPYDLRVVDGVGISEREPRDLSTTRPFTEQHLSSTDMEVIGGLALAISVGDAAEDSLRFLTYMELEMMQAIASRIEREAQHYSPEQRAGIPRVQTLIEAEIHKRPS